jgi:hypothetical protein
MKPQPWWSIRFERSRDERVALLVLCPLLVAFCIGVVRRLDPLLNDDSMRIPRWIVHDAIYTCLLFLGLAFVWGCFRPRWIERSLESAAKRVRSLICAVLLFFFIIGPLLTLLVEAIRNSD